MRNLLLITYFLICSLTSSAQFSNCAFDTTDFNKQIKESYSVGFFIPLDLDRSISGSVLSKDDFKKYTQYYYNYYQGILIALEELNEDYDEMPDINAYIIDSESPTEGLEAWDKNKISSLDLVFSALTEENDDLVKKMKKSNIPLISTLSLSTPDKDYDHYIQVQPTLEVHCQNIAQHIAETYNYNANVICIHDESDVSVRAMAYGSMQNTVKSLSFPEIYSNKRLESMLSKTKTNVLYVTILNPSRAQEVLDSIYAIQGYRIDIYGMPTWTTLNVNKYTDKNINITMTTGFYKHSADKGKNFNDTYKKRYGEDAPGIAYKGYESTLYFLSRFLESENNFYLELLEDQEPRPINDIRIEEHCDKKNLKYWENTNVYFIESKDGSVLLDGE